MCDMTHSWTWLICMCDMTFTGVHSTDPWQIYTCIYIYTHTHTYIYTHTLSLSLSLITGTRAATHECSLQYSSAANESVQNSSAADWHKYSLQYFAIQKSIAKSICVNPLQKSIEKTAATLFRCRRVLQRLRKRLTRDKHKYTHIHIYIYTYIHTRTHTRTRTRKYLVVELRLVDALRNTLMQHTAELRANFIIGLLVLIFWCAICVTWLIHVCDTTHFWRPLFTQQPQWVV